MIEGAKILPALLLAIPHPMTAAGDAVLLHICGSDQTLSLPLPGRSTPAKDPGDCGQACHFGMCRSNETSAKRKQA